MTAPVIDVVASAALPGPAATVGAVPDTRSEPHDVTPVPAAPAAPVVADVDLPELRFVRPLPGFGELSRFVLVSLDESDPKGLLFELRSLEREDVRFLVAPPAPFFPDYEVDLDDDTASDLGLEGPDDALVLVVLTLGADGAHTTANLLAPVVLNARTRAAAQVILSGSDWPVRATVA